MNILLTGSVHELSNQVKKPIALSRASEASSLPNQTRFHPTAEELAKLGNGQERATTTTKERLKSFVEVGEQLRLGFCFGIY